MCIMKINWKSIFGNKVANLSVGKELLEYDKHVEFYFTNLINSIILFSLTSEELLNLAEPWFDPIFELEAEIDYAFTPVCFESIFRNGLIDNSFKNKLLEFKNETDNIPSEIWDWEFIDSHEAWTTIRYRANELLNELGIASRKYNDDYTTVYDRGGKIIKKGEKP